MHNPYGFRCHMAHCKLWLSGSNDIHWLLPGKPTFAGAIIFNVVVTNKGLPAWLNPCMRTEFIHFRIACTYMYIRAASRLAPSQWDSKVTPSLIGWAQTKNQPCIYNSEMSHLWFWKCLVVTSPNLVKYQPSVNLTFRYKLDRNVNQTTNCFNEMYL